MSHELVVDWTRCDKHGLCAVLAPGVIVLDEWGFPAIRDGLVSSERLRAARRAAAACPALALRLNRSTQGALA